MANRPIPVLCPMGRTLAGMRKPRERRSRRRRHSGGSPRASARVAGPLKPGRRKGKGQRGYGCQLRDSKTIAGHSHVIAFIRPTACCPHSGMALLQASDPVRDGSRSRHAVALPGPSRSRCVGSALQHRCRVSHRPFVRQPMAGSWPPGARDSGRFRLQAAPSHRCGPLQASCNQTGVPLTALGALPVLVGLLRRRHRR